MGIIGLSDALKLCNEIIGVLLKTSATNMKACINSVNLEETRFPQSLERQTRNNQQSNALENCIV